MRIIKCQQYIFECFPAWTILIVGQLFNLIEANIIRLTLTYYSPVINLNWSFILKKLELIKKVIDLLGLSKILLIHILI